MVQKGLLFKVIHSGEAGINLLLPPVTLKQKGRVKFSNSENGDIIFSYICLKYSLKSAFTNLICHLIRIL